MPMTSSCAVSLHLRIRTAPKNRAKLLEFLHAARPFYESPGGIRMRLLQDSENENAFIEVFEYATFEAYQLDEQRVLNDPKMKAYLEVWRSLLDGSPIVEIYQDLTDALGVSQREAAVQLDGHEGG